MKNNETFDQERIVDEGVYQETPDAGWQPTRPVTLPENRFAKGSSKLLVNALLVTAVLFTIFWIVPTVVNLRVPGVAFLTVASAIIGIATPIYFIIKLNRK